MPGPSKNQISFKIDGLNEAIDLLKRLSSAHEQSSQAAAKQQNAIERLTRGMIEEASVYEEAIRLNRELAIAAAEAATARKAAALSAEQKEIQSLRRIAAEIARMRNELRAMKMPENVLRTLHPDFARAERQIETALAPLMRAERAIASQKLREAARIERQREAMFREQEARRRREEIEPAKQTEAEIARFEAERERRAQELFERRLREAARVERQREAMFREQEARRRREEIEPARQTEAEIARFEAERERQARELFERRLREAARIERQREAMFREQEARRRREEIEPARQTEAEIARFEAEKERRAQEFFERRLREAARVERQREAMFRAQEARRLREEIEPAKQTEAEIARFEAEKERQAQEFFERRNRQIVAARLENVELGKHVNVLRQVAATKGTLADVERIEEINRLRRIGLTEKEIESHVRLRQEAERLTAEIRKNQEAMPSAAIRPGFRQGLLGALGQAGFGDFSRMGGGGGAGRGGGGGDGGPVGPSFGFLAGRFAGFTLIGAGILSAARGAERLGASMRNAVTEAIRFNAELENTQLAVGGSITAVGDLTDAFGKPLDITTKIAVSLGEARLGTAALLEDAVRLAVPVRSLQEGFAIAAAQARAAGIHGEQQRRVIEGIVILAQRLNIPISNLAKTIDNIFSGLRVSQTTIGRMLGLSDSLVQRFKDQNRLGAELEQRLSGVLKIQEQIALTTFAGLQARIQSQLRLLAVDVGGGGFQAIKDVFTQFTHALDALQQSGLLSGLRDLATILTKLALGGITGTAITFLGPFAALGIASSAAIGTVTRPAREREIEERMRRIARGIRLLSAGPERLERMGLMEEAIRMQGELTQELADLQSLVRLQGAAATVPLTQTLEQLVRAEPLLQRGRTLDEALQEIERSETEPTAVPVVPAIRKRVSRTSPKAVPVPRETEQRVISATRAIRAYELALESAKNTLTEFNAESETLSKLFEKIEEQAPAIEARAAQKRLQALLAQAEREEIVTDQTIDRLRRQALAVREAEIARVIKEREQTISQIERAPSTREEDRRRRDRALATLRREIEVEIEAIDEAHRNILSRIDERRQRNIERLHRIERKNVEQLIAPLKQRVEQSRFDIELNEATIHVLRTQLQLHELIGASTSTRLATVGQIHELERANLALRMRAIDAEIEAVQRRLQIPVPQGIDAEDIARILNRRQRQEQELNRLMAERNRLRVEGQAVLLAEQIETQRLAGQYINLGELIRDTLTNVATGLAFRSGDLGEIGKRFGQSLGAQFFRAFIDEKLQGLDRPLRANLFSFGQRDAPVAGEVSGRSFGVSFADTATSTISQIKESITAPPALTLADTTSRIKAIQALTESGVPLSQAQRLTSETHPAATAAGAGAGAAVSAGGLSAGAAIGIGVSIGLLSGSIRARRERAQAQRQFGARDRDIYEAAARGFAEGIGLPFLGELQVGLGRIHPILADIFNPAFGVARAFGLFRAPSPTTQVRSFVTKLFKEIGFSGRGVNVRPFVAGPEADLARQVFLATKSERQRRELLGFRALQISPEAQRIADEGIRTARDFSALGALSGVLLTQTLGPVTGLGVERLPGIGAIAGGILGGKQASMRRRIGQMFGVDIRGPLFPIASGIEALRAEAEAASTLLALGPARKARGGREFFVERATEGILNQLTALGLAGEDASRIIREFGRASAESFDVAINRVISLRAEGKLTNEEFLDLVARGLGVFAEDMPRGIDRARIATLAFGEDGTISIERVKRAAEDVTNVISQGVPAAFDKLVRSRSAQQAASELASKFSDTFLSRVSERILQRPEISQQLTEAQATLFEAAERLAGGDIEGARELISLGTREFLGARADFLRHIVPIADVTRATIGNLGIRQIPGVFFTERLPSFETKTVKEVPGMPGQPQLIVAHGGEKVMDSHFAKELLVELRRLSASTGSIVINFVPPPIEVDGHKIQTTVNGGRRKATVSMKPDTRIGVAAHA